MGNVVYRRRPYGGRTRRGAGGEPSCRAGSQAAGASAVWRSVFAAAIAAGALASGRAQAADEADVQPADMATTPVDASAEHVDELIDRLGDPEFFVREQAQAELARIGFAAFDALSAAQQHADLEIASRAEALVRQMQIEWTTPNDPPAVKGLLKGYATADEDKRLELLETLAELPHEQGLPVICRLVRYDKSPVLSKLAALRLIEQSDGDRENWAARAELLERHIGKSERPGAGWLRVYAATLRDPAGAAERWGELAAEEEKAFRLAAQQSDAAIVAALWRQQLSVFRQQDDPAGALEAVARIAVLQPDDNDPLIEYLNWIADDKAWDALDKAAERLDSRLDSDAVLLYTLAEARRAQGAEAQAESAVAQALALGGDNQLEHLKAAAQLQQHGMFDWAEREYRRSIEVGDAGRAYGIRAHTMLAEMFHDQGQDAEAAATLSDAMAAVEQLDEDERVQELARVDSTPDTLAARRHFFVASDHKRHGRRDEQLAEALTGLDRAPTDIDLLILLHRTPDLDAEQQARLERNMSMCIDELRGDIRQMPDQPYGYNQLAWLLSNTERDAHEAIELSKKSLELQPDYAGFLDTLGRCHFAAGELEEAVKQQSRAVELDPHSGQIRRQLEEFEAALAEAKSAETRAGEDQPQRTEETPPPDGPSASSDVPSALPDVPSAPADETPAAPSAP